MGKPTDVVTMDQVRYEVLSATGAFCGMLLALEADSKVIRAAIFVFAMYTDSLDPHGEVRRLVQQ